ncbi:hypothetical protein, partial [Delftia acidovorans]|uniref:hypothetical protein n=1 Tax=Delftia acidovorans TaxID=80866 RepID=UPI0028E605BA
RPLGILGALAQKTLNTLLAKSLHARQPRDTLLPLVTRRLICASLRGSPLQEPPRFSERFTQS